MKKKKKHHSKGRKTFKAINQILSIISVIITLVFIFIVFKANIIPTKYLIIIIALLSIINIIYLLLCFKLHNKAKSTIVTGIIIILIIAIELIASLKLNETINFLNKNLTNQYYKDTYYIIVNKESNYKVLEDIKNKTLNIYYTDDDKTKLEEAIKDKINVEIEYSNNGIELLTNLLEDNQKIILVHSGIYEAMLELDTTYEEKTTILDKIEVTTKVKTKASNKNLIKEPFIIYLSGIDNRNGDMPTTCLSDVNIFIVVNPNTKKILLVHTPRDYFVNLHGINQKDKLTHAGMIGGINMSKATLEETIGYDADHYVRVNFNSVINLVDAIGGITINNDLNRNLTCHTNKKCIFKPGNNNVDGKCALAFARERMAYPEGDRHRGENQEQIIEAIFNKMKSEPSVLANYSEILNALDGTFESSMSTNELTSLIKYMLSDNSNWTIETQNLNGPGEKAVGFAFKNRVMQVVMPDQNSINQAREKIKQILNEK